MQRIWPRSGHTGICNGWFCRVSSVGTPLSRAQALQTRRGSCIGDRTNGCASPRLIVYSATDEGSERASDSHAFPNFREGPTPSFLH